MSYYAIVVFDVLTFEPRCFYNGGRSCDLSVVSRAADSAAWRYGPRGLNTALYAVFDVGDCCYSELPSSRPWVSYGPPVYVPADCEALNRAHTWREDALAAEASAPALAPLPLPQARHSTVWLNDGTPCCINRIDPYYTSHSEGMSGPIVQVELLERSPTYNTGGSYSNWALGHIAWFWVETGMYVGAGDTAVYPRVFAMPPEAVAAWVDPADVVEPVAPTVRFEVRSGVNGTDRNTWSSVADFDSGKDAAAWVSERKASYTSNGKTLVIVRVELGEGPAVDWRAREAGRLESGDYLPLPAGWYDKIAAAYPDHYAHLSSGDKRKIAFTESASAGERDRQKVLSAAEYASRYFGGQSVKGWWSGAERASFVADVLGDSVVPLIAPLGDAEAMVELYEQCNDGPAHGCMSYSEGHFCSHLHPVTVYARGGEISVAVLKGAAGSGTSFAAEPDFDATVDSEGPVLARCLVWYQDGQPRHYGRQYGATTHVRLLRTGLEAMGFVEGDFSGAKIAKIKNRGGDGGFVMPYLDIGGQAVTDMGTHWMVGRHCGGDAYDCTNTNGLIADVPTVECEHCGEDVDEGDVSRVYVDRYTSELWCSSCCNDGASYCDYSGRYISDTSIVSVIREGSSWPINVAEWYISDGDISAVWDDSSDRYIEGGFECEDCNGVFAGSELREASDGCSVCGDCLAEREASEAEETEETEAA